jgi:hypothetical protein
MIRRSGVVCLVLRASSSICAVTGRERVSRWQQWRVQTVSATWWHTSDRTQDQTHSAMSVGAFGQCDFYPVKG